jgi:hypothetical protein
MYRILVLDAQAWFGRKVNDKVSRRVGTLGRVDDVVVVGQVTVEDVIDYNLPVDREKFRGQTLSALPILQNERRRRRLLPETFDGTIQTKTQTMKSK